MPTYYEFTVKCSICEESLHIQYGTFQYNLDLEDRIKEHLTILMEQHYTGPPERHNSGKRIPDHKTIKDSITENITEKPLKVAAS